MVQQGIVVGIVALLVVPGLFSMSTTTQAMGSGVITVDDEPGDADYTSIGDAVEHSQAGDTIEVYSGWYNEPIIDVGRQALKVKGVAHELGSGNDTGKPIVNSTRGQTFVVWGKSVVISNFSFYCLNDAVDVFADNCTICDNDVKGGLWPINIRDDERPRYFIGAQILRNTIENVSNAVTYYGIDGTISANRISRCYEAIDVGYGSQETTISHNIITGCSIGIQYSDGSGLIANNSVSAWHGLELSVPAGDHVLVLHNIFHNCSIGLDVFIQRNTTRVVENNFIDNKYDVWFYQNHPRDYNLFSPIFSDNFYDSWQGTGPVVIRGRAVIFWIPFLVEMEIFFEIPIWVPWFYRDRHPAQTPFEIDV